MSLVEVAFPQFLVPVSLIELTFFEGTAVGALLEYYACNSGPNQAFAFVPASEGSIRAGAVNLVGMGSKLCVAAC